MKLFGPVNLQWKIWAIMAGISLVVALILGLVVKFFTIAAYLGGAFILKIITRPIINRIESRGYSRTYATIFVFTGLVTLMLFLLYLFVPMIINEVQTINSDFPSFKEKIEHDILTKKVIDSSEVYFLSFMGVEFELGSFDNIRRQLESFLSMTLSVSGEILFGIFIVIPLLTVILINTGADLKRQFFSLIPNNYFEVSIAMLDGINKTISNFVYAKFIQSAIVAVVGSLGFFLLGLKGWLLLGLLVGLLNIIPYLGPILSIFPVFIMGYFYGDLLLALSSVGIVLIAQLVDNLFTQPVVIPRLMNHHPLTVILITLIGAELYGPIGMILAIVAFSIVKTVFVTVYRGLNVLVQRDDESCPLLDENKKNVTESAV